LEIHLQVGRILRGRLLATAVLLRQLPWVYVSGGDPSRVAPAWVVVRNRADGAQLLRVSAGRQSGAGELIFSSMSKDAGELSREAFLERWRQRR